MPHRSERKIATGACLLHEPLSHEECVAHHRIEERDSCVRQLTRVVAAEVCAVTVLNKSDIFLDVCTQKDYLVPGGARPCENACNIVTNIRRVMAYGRWEKVPMLSCIDARRVDEVRGLPRPECVEGTRGQQKLSFTLMPSRMVVESDNSLSVSLDILEHVQQAILVKRHRDPFTNPKFDRLLTEMPARRFVVFGLPLENSIRLLVLGLLLRNRKVAIVTDACGYWNQSEAEMAMRQIAAKGCELVTAEGLIQTALARRKTIFRSRPRTRRSVA